MANFGFNKEIVSIHVGQGGVQMGQAVWELLSLEHGIQADGKLEKPTTERSFSTFFEETLAEQFVPRVLFVDLEATVVDELRSGPYREMYNPDQIINGKEDASNNFARGYHSSGKKILPQVCDEIRCQIEQCNTIQGIFVYHAMGGGTGSGFASQLDEYVGANFGKITKIDFPIYPSPSMSSSCVEPYNTLLSQHYGMDYSDICFIMDNEALYEICVSQLGMERPTFSSVNRVLSQAVSALTASLRFEGPMNGDITQLQTNLIPYPRIHFPLINFAPIMSSVRANHSKNSVANITRDVFDPHNCMVKCDPSEGKYMACCLLYRGDINPPEINQAVTNIKNTTDVQFVNWCPTGFKIGINNMPSTTVPGSGIATTKRNVTLITNTNAIADAFDRLLIKFDALYEKRAFIHWFIGEGLEEADFNEAIENIDALIQDYDEACESDFNDEDEFDNGVCSSQRDILMDESLNDMNAGPPSRVKDSKPLITDTTMSKNPGSDISEAEGEGEFDEEFDD